MTYTGKNTYVKLLFMLYFWENPQCGNEEKEFTGEKKLARDETNLKSRMMFPSPGSIGCKD